MIARDFNFHLDDLNNRHAKQFVDILDGFGLQQHVKGPTHKKGHTLDFIITRSVVELDDDLVQRVKVRDPCIADHFEIASPETAFWEEGGEILQVTVH